MKKAVEQKPKSTTPTPPPPQKTKKDERCYVGCTDYLWRLAGEGKSFEEIRALADKKFHPTSLGGVKLILTGSRDGTKLKERKGKATKPTPKPAAAKSKVKRAKEQIAEGMTKLSKTPPAKKV